jgi:hypothetical protein
METNYALNVVNTSNAQNAFGLDIRSYKTLDQLQELVYRTFLCMIYLSLGRERERDPVMYQIFISQLFATFQNPKNPNPWGWGEGGIL